MKSRWLTKFRFAYPSMKAVEEPQTPKAECEALMNATLPFAENMLRKDGEFFPYGGALQSNGKIVCLAGYDGREHPPSTDVMILLKQGFTAGAKSGEYKATALIYDVRATIPSSGAKSDAIAISLNHRAGYSVIVLYPYELTQGDLVFGETFAQEGESDIFVRA